MERIAKHMSDIEKWSKELESMDIKRIDDLDDIKNFHATSMVMFSIFNAVISIGEETISTKRLGFPGSYREIFEILEKNKIIDKRLLKKMLPMRMKRPYQKSRIARQSTTRSSSTKARTFQTVCSKSLPHC